MQDKLSPAQVIVLASVPATILHFSWLPAWLTASCLLFWSIIYFSNAWYQKLKCIVTSLIGLIAFVVVVISFGLTYSLDLCVALLGILLAIKPLELRTKRDQKVTLFIALFFNFASLYYFSSLFFTIYLFTSAIFIIGIIYYIELETVLIKDSFKYALRISLEAIPLVILIFLLFPRLQSSFWSVSQGDRGRSGFSESFRIDDIRKLTMDNTPAFRVEFEGDLPPSEERYWRGLVYENFDGTYWKYNKRNSTRRYIPLGNKEYSYQIILEPHDSKWLFALDLPKTWSGIHNPIYRDHTFQAEHKIHDSYYYRVTSVTGSKMLGDRKVSLATLSLPNNFNQRTKDLGLKWREESRSADEILQKAITFFSQNGFIYSLEPLPLGRNSIDDFLFKSKQGYCEHYASSFAFLMRAAGIPARVVGGYMGGEENQVGKYLIVRQSDAHVWVEIWNHNKWQRIDPTAFVAPGRISGGLRAAIPEEDIPYLKNELRFGDLYQLWKKIYYRIDAINFAWITWIESYSRDAQINLLKKFGIDLKNKFEVVGLFMFVIAVFILTAILITYSISRRNRKKQDDIALAYQKLLNKLAKRGINKPAFMGPREFSELIKKFKLKQSKEICDLLFLYEEIRFNKKTTNSINFASEIKKVT